MTLCALGAAGIPRSYVRLLNIAKSVYHWHAPAYAPGARALPLASRGFTAQELAEVFPSPPLREVAFEIRFPPRLRVQAEIWSLQDQLVGKYPEVRGESAIQPTRTVVDDAVFASPAEARVIKVTSNNFMIAFTRYSCS